MSSINFDESCDDSTLALLGCNAHAILNYVLLLLNFICWYHSLNKTINVNKIQEEEKQIEQERYPIDDDEKKKPQPLKDHQHYYYFAFLAFMIITLLQVGICSITKRAGVSVIWFALDGWVMRDILRRQYNVDEKEVKFIAFFSGVTLVDGAVVVYYFFTDAPAVTAARVFAHFLGAILSQLSLTCFFKFGAKRGDDIADTVDSETNSANDDLESGSIRSDEDGNITDVHKDDGTLEKDCERDDESTEKEEKLKEEV